MIRHKMKLVIVRFMHFLLKILLKKKSQKVRFNNLELNKMTKQKHVHYLKGEKFDP